MKVRFSNTRRKVIISIFVVSVVLHLIWELCQCFAYEVDLNSWGNFLFNVVATIGDGFIVLGIYALGRILFRDRFWFNRNDVPCCIYAMGFGAFIAVFGELAALNLGLWAYNRHMPVIPGLTVGLFPVLQMSLLPLLSFKMVNKLFLGYAGGLSLSQWPNHDLINRRTSIGY